MATLILLLGISCFFSAGMMLNQMISNNSDLFQRIIFAVDVVLGFYLIVSAIGMIGPTV